MGFIARAAVARLAARAGKARLVAGFVAAVFAAVSLAGILNALPYQGRVYLVFSKETGIVGFVHNQDPVFAAYRYLARAPGVAALLYINRPYSNLPGCYYLHREIPFYDVVTGQMVGRNLETLSAPVTHIVSENPGIFIPGYSPEREFGNVRILRRDANEPEIRKWESYNPTIVSNTVKVIMKNIDPDVPSPPANRGIRFAPSKRPETCCVSRSRALNPGGLPV